MWTAHSEGTILPMLSFGSNLSPRGRSLGCRLVLHIGEGRHDSNLARLGHLVFFVPFAWIFVLIGFLIGSDYHEPDEAKALAMIYRMGALALALATVTLWIISRYRSRVAPGRDEFSFIPMKYYIYVMAASALAAFAVSFFAIDFF